MGRCYSATLPILAKTAAPFPCSAGILHAVRVPTDFAGPALLTFPLYRRSPPNSRRVAQFAVMNSRGGSQTRPP